MALDHPLQRVGLGFPLLGEVRRVAPCNAHEWTVDVDDGTPAGGPQGEVPVLVLAARDLLVQEANAVEKDPAIGMVGGGVHHHHPRTQQVRIAHLVAASQPSVRLAVVVHDDPARGKLGARHRPQGTDLGTQLSWEPFVIVVAEGDEIATESENAGIAGAGEAGSTGIRQHPDPMAVCQALVGLAPVVHHNRLDLAGVVLREDCRKGHAQLCRAVARG